MHNAQGFYKVPYQQQCIDDSEYDGGFAAHKNCIKG